MSPGVFLPMVGLRDEAESIKTLGNSTGPNKVQECVVTKPRFIIEGYKEWVRRAK